MTLFGGSIYLLQWLYPQFDLFELQTFALYLAASFVGMTLGAFFVFLPLSFSSKKRSTPTSVEAKQADRTPEATEALNPVDTQDEKQELDASDSLETADQFLEVDASIESIHEVDSVTVQQKEDIALEPEKEPILPKPSNEAMEEAQYDQVLIAAPLFPIQNTQDHLFNPSNLADETDTHIRLKLSDIEPWAHQRRIKRLADKALLTLIQKQRAGLSLAIIQSQGKDIGYISRIEYAKVRDKLERLNRIELDEVMYERSKVVHVGIKFIFNKTI